MMRRNLVRLLVGVNLSIAVIYVLLGLGLFMSGSLWLSAPYLLMGCTVLFLLTKPHRSKDHT